MKRFRFISVRIFNIFRIDYGAASMNQEMFAEENSSIRMNSDARRGIIKGYEQAVSRRINIPGQKRKLAWREMMKYQAVSLAKAYRTGKSANFVPYIMEA